MITKIKSSQSLYSLLLCSMLTACGGGGDSDNGGNTTPPSSGTLTLSLSSASVSLNEGATTEITLSGSYSEGSNIAYSAEVTQGDADLVILNVNQNTLTLSANEIEADSDIKISITASAGGLTNSKELSLSVVNTSAEAVIAEASLWTDSNKVFKFDDLEQVAQLYVQSAYLAGIINGSQKQSFTKDLNDTFASARASSQLEEAQRLATAITNYQQSSLTESQLIQALSQHKAFVQTQSDSILSALKVNASMSSDLPVIHLAPYQYVEQYDTFSAVVGNPSLGSFQDDKWAFSGEFSFLNQQVPVLATPSPCDAE